MSEKMSAMRQLLHMAGTLDTCPDCDAEIYQIANSRGHITSFDPGGTKHADTCSGGGVDITVMEPKTLAVIKSIEAALYQTLTSKLPMADQLDNEEAMKVVAWAYKVTIALLELRIALTTA